MKKNNSILKNLLKVMPVLNDFSGKLALSVYRELSKGFPVPKVFFANLYNVPKNEIQEELNSWNGVYYNGNDDIIAFGGLGISSDGPHKIKFEERVLSTWCFWDTLFIPEILNKPVDIESKCPITNDIIKLRVSKNGIVGNNFPNGIVSFIEFKAINESIINSFCRYVHFFPDEESLSLWLPSDKKGELMALTVREAFQLGRDFNKERFGDLLVR